MALLYSNAFALVLYSNYEICGRYLVIIVLVRNIIIHIFSYGYSFMKDTPDPVSYNFG